MPQIETIRGLPYVRLADGSLVLAVSSIPSDPLSLSEYIEIGTNPAQSGSIRLSPGLLMAVHSPTEETDLPLLEYDDTDEALWLGDSEGIVSIAPRTNDVSSLGYQGHRWKYIQASYQIAARDAEGNQAEMRPTFIELLSASFLQARFDVSGSELLMILGGLPTVDPVSATQVFTTDGAGLAAALAGGARYLLISAGA